MSTEINESFAPRRCNLMSDYRRELLMMDYQRQLTRVSCSRRLQKSVAVVRNLAKASPEDLSMIVLLASLLVITLLLPWVVS